MAQPPISKVQDVLSFIPPNLRENELYPKLSEMMNFIMDQAVADLVDTKYKWTGPEFQEKVVIQEIIKELGFEYISEVMDTITNFEFNTLLSFVSLINLLKGSRTGLELVLILLGFDSAISEWWERDPVHEVYTFEIVVIMDSNRVPNVFETLEKVKIFAREYVYPVIENIDFRFSFSFAEKNATVAGFAKPSYFGVIMKRA
jgi:hypothetical protein